MSDCEAYENTLKDIEEFLSPEWEEAEKEVFADGNQGWAMIAKTAIKMRVERAKNNERIDIEADKEWARKQPHNAQ
jgi:hypothetical protein